MRSMRRLGFGAGFWLAAAMVSKAMALGAAAVPAGPHAVPVVAFGEEGRQDPAGFARLHGLDPIEVKRGTAASGLISCGNAQAAGQLTLTDDLITTAAHVFYDEAGKLRADSGHCQFILVAGDELVLTTIDVTSVVAGTKDPYRESPARDWAVARLMRAVKGVTPYAIGRASEGAAVRFAARGSIDWRSRADLAMQQCALRSTLEAAPEGTREVAFDCDAGQGASGGALLDARGRGLVAIFAGFRSTTPGAARPFAADHYNFAVTVEGAFRRAIATAAGRDLDPVGSISR